ncbi:hypothetical protein [Vallicoccus soli]|uniref:hypothetical protein n=1 Tax=Vallicoccus soli TaxID=2339232 RepID=UPI001403866B|nr:hypothetical protein [Vallicoccus soli]
MLLLPCYWLLTYAIGLEAHALLTAVALLTAAGYLLGRSLGRSRHVPDPRMLRARG